MEKKVKLEKFSRLGILTNGAPESFWIHICAKLGVLIFSDFILLWN